ncbi:3-ketoacyl-CoA thiolase 2, peroxisomal [Tanacetum coccineum]
MAVASKPKDTENVLKIEVKKLSSSLAKQAALAEAAIAKEAGSPNVASQSDDSSLTDPWIGDVAHRAGVTRHQAAVHSHEKAAAAAATAYGKSVTLKPEMKDLFTISVHEGIRPGTNLANLTKLKPVFWKDGLTTAGTQQQSFEKIMASANQDIVADKLDEVITIIQNIPGLTAQEHIRGMHVIGRDASKAHIVLLGSEEDKIIYIQMLEDGSLD